MKTSPCAKINIGLNVVSRRSDGYHNLETIVYPIPLYDELEAVFAEAATGVWRRRLLQEGMTIDCPEDDNLVIRAYDLISKDHELPRIEFRLRKGIPSQAGMGGGSSDVGYAIRMLNEMCDLGLSDVEMRCYASNLGADCALFVDPMPYYGTGIGDILTPCADKMQDLRGMHMAIVKPPVAVSTREAYSLIRPRAPRHNCLTAVGRPIEEWREMLSNDFEESVFALHPIVGQVKSALYGHGALYAQMSGSGSAVFGIFASRDDTLAEVFGGMYFRWIEIR